MTRFWICGLIGAALFAAAGSPLAAQRDDLRQRLTTGARMVSADAMLSRETRESWFSVGRLVSTGVDGEVGYESFVTSRLAVGLRVRSFVSLNTLEPRSPLLGPAMRDWYLGARIGPRVSFVQPLTRAWFGIGSGAASVGRDLTFSSEGGASSGATIGSVSAGFGLGRLMTNTTAIVAEVRRSGARNFDMGTGVFPDELWTWDARLGVRLFLARSGK